MVRLVDCHRLGLVPYLLELGDRKPGDGRRQVEDVVDMGSTGARVGCGTVEDVIGCEPTLSIQFLSGPRGLRS